MNSPKKVHITKQIFTINGKQYSSLEEVPEKYRTQLDKNNDGVADMFEDIIQDPQFTSNLQNAKQFIPSSSQNQYIQESKSSIILRVMLFVFAIAVCYLIFSAYLK